MLDPSNLFQCSVRRTHNLHRNLLQRATDNVTLVGDRRAMQCSVSTSNGRGSNEESLDSFISAESITIPETEEQKTEIQTRAGR